MNVLLGILDYYQPALPFVGLALLLLGALYFYSHRPVRDVPEAPPDDYDTRLLEDAQWPGRGFDAWLEQYEQEQERER